MASTTVPVRDMKGLTPAVDPAVSSEIFALTGRNYLFDSLGPRSIYGNRLLLPHERTKPNQVQGIRVRIRDRDRTFLMDGDGIWEWRESPGGFVNIYATPDTSLSPYRWSHGYLNGYLYLAHPRVGLLALDIDSGICYPHYQIGEATPEEVLAITINNGRLIVVGPTLFSWSEPSNGLSFVPTLGGGGFQVIGDKVPGNPIAVSDYVRGCLTWTAGGVMRSEFTGDAAVYRHRAIHTDYRPVNSFCSVRVDNDSVIILDERGLFRSQGESPAPYAPVFNEFLANYIQEHDLNIGNNLRLEWDSLRRLLYVSVSHSYASNIYEKAFVYYPPLDKWGIFNEEHYGILPILIADSQRADDYFGFVDSEGRVRYWDDVGSREKPASESTSKRSANLYRPITPRTVQDSDSDLGTYMPAWGRADTVSRAGMTQPAGYYVTGATTPITPELLGLDSKIQFGLFRPNGNQAADEMSEVVNVLIRSVQSGDPATVSEDFLTVPDTSDNQDYNIVTGTLDYGITPTTYVNHGFRIIGSLDGITEFQSTEPSLVGFVRGARYYSCSCVGVWHIMEVTAANPGESFHIKAFEPTFVPAGRLL